MIYVALLRGINAGLNNRIDMKKLKMTFESLGFKNVATYIKSALPKLIGTKVYKQMTVRNVNTLRKLNQMMSV